MKPLDWILLFLLLFMIFVMVSGGFELFGGFFKIDRTEKPALLFIICFFLRRVIHGRFISSEPWFKSFSTRASAFINRHSMAIIVVLFVLYFVVMSAVVCYRHFTFQTHGHDLGIFTQVMYNSCNGDFLFSSILGNRSFMGEHFSPVLIMLIPLYHIFQTPYTLLILQTAALACAVFPIYHLARRELPSTVLGTLVAVMFLSYEPLRNVNLYDFHPIAFVVPLLAFAFYFLSVERVRLFLLFMGFTLLMKEEMAMVFAWVGIFIFLFKRKRLLGISMFVIGLGLFLVEVFLIIPYFRGGGHYSFVGRYSHLGRTIPSIVWQVVSHPFKMIALVFSG
ncbi:MAG: DUF2079 domain-containing protein, partial [Thermoplasmata archaeon]|nr:DUF2079 domain-containing protein [Thermoplasmata archaeon]